MKKKMFFVVAGLGLAQPALVVSDATAQDSSKVLNDVVITATKTDQKQSQTGKVVTVITREQLERSSGKTVPELLNQQAGIIVGGAGSNPGKDKSLFFRGAGSSFSITLLDGILVSDPSGNGGAFDLRLFPIDQIERIEILRGGQATLYGSDAVAGVINIITKKGGTDGVNISGVAAAGSYGAVKGSIGINGSKGAFSYNVNYSHQQSDGISEAFRPDESTVQFDKDGFTHEAVNANFSIKPSSGISINPFFRYFYADVDYDANNFEDAQNRNFITHYNTGVNSVYSLSGNSKITLNYSYENSDRVYKSAFPSTLNGTVHIADLFYNQNLGKNFNLLVGVDNRFTAIRQVGDDNERPDANLLSAYGSVIATGLGSFFNIEAGGRLNRHSAYGNNFTYSVTPSLSFLENKLKFFGTVGKAFKAPTISELFGPYGANPGLKPQKADNYEAGYQVSLMEDKFKFRAVWYERYLKDALFYGPQGYINLDKQDDWGFEVEPSFTINKVTLNGFWAYVEGTTITKDANGASIYTDGLLRRPKHSLGLGIDYQATEALFISANLRNYSRRDDIYYDANFSSVPVSLDSYQLLDAYAQYRFNNRVKVFVDIKNMLNQEYFETVGYSTMGANFNAGLSINIL